ncbi:lactonase family protein [Paenibacillus sp. Aloe-11]|uniref:lactonase family protein n=1 Tax=Paenibacillus sp. Aloe-11 TaxID=1050222 RepID=UPI0003087C54|nr:lactonase family protein [Paenibacillus sp. Aloe-11]
MSGMDERNEQLFYTGTYASRDERGIYVCALDIEDGDLRIIGGVEGIERPIATEHRKRA